MNGRWWAPALAVGIAAGCFGGLVARAQEGGAEARAEVWESKVVVWTAEDTRAVLSVATGNSVGEPAEMLRQLAEEMSPIESPALHMAVQQRLGERVTEAGAEGWRLAWIRESTTVVDGYALPAPAVFLERRVRR